MEEDSASKGWCAHEAQEGMQEVTTEGGLEDTKSKLWRLKELIEEPKARGDWNSKRKSELSTDASEEAVSVPFLYQCGQSMKPVACMSHTPTKPERQHVQIEKAALAPVHKCKISLLYLWEASVSWTDHKTFLTLPRGTW